MTLQDVREGGVRRSGSIAAMLGRAGIRLEPLTLLTGLIVILVIFAILYSLFRLAEVALVVDGRFDLAALIAPARTPWFGSMVRDSVSSIAAATALALIFGTFLAWANERTDASLRLLGGLLPLLPLLVPGIAMAIGWVFLASPDSGFINALLKVIPVLPDSFQINILSRGGMIFVFSLYLVPYVFLITSSALRNIDTSLEEASYVSGAGIVRTLFLVSIPAVRQAIIAAALLAVMVGLGLYSIPLVLGTPDHVDMASVRIIRLVTLSYPADVQSASILGLYLMVIIAVLWLAYRRISTSGAIATIGGRAQRFAMVSLGPWRWVVRGLMLIYALCSTILPAVALVIVAFQRYWTPRVDFTKFSWKNFQDVLANNEVFAAAFRNSTVMGVLVGGLLIAIVTLVTVFGRRHTGVLSTLSGIVTKIPAAISNVVLALAVLVAFAGPPFAFGGTFIILILAYCIIYMPPASIAAEAAVSQVGEELLEASAVAGASDTRTAINVLLPLMAPGLLSGWALVFVHIVGDLEASSLLGTPGAPVVGYVVNNSWSAGTYGQLAALSVCIFAVTSVVVAIMIAVARWTRRGLR